VSAAVGHLTMLSILGTNLFIIDFIIPMLSLLGINQSRVSRLLPLGHQLIIIIRYLFH
jgi:hypothetical protein